MLRVLTVLALTFICSGTASAAPFTWELQGTVASLAPRIGGPTPLDDAFSVGQPFTWLITMESDAPDHDPTAGCGFYTPIVGMQFTSGALSLGTSTAPGQDVFVNPVGSGFCEIPFDNTGRLRTDFARALYVNLDFFGTFTTDALPINPALLTPGTVTFLYGGSGQLGMGTALAYGRVTSFTTVPEPTTVTLAGIGLVALVRRHRSLRRRP